MPSSTLFIANKQFNCFLRFVVKDSVCHFFLFFSYKPKCWLYLQLLGCTSVINKFIQISNINLTNQHHVYFQRVVLTVHLKTEGDRGDAEQGRLAERSRWGPQIHRSSSKAPWSRDSGSRKQNKRTTGRRSNLREPTKTSSSCCTVVQNMRMHCRSRKQS